MNILQKVFLVTGTLLAPLMGSVGCMDNSKHTHIQDGYDYKTLHYVTCTCPCEKQRHLLRKGKCFKCRHYLKHDGIQCDMSFLRKKDSESLFGKIRPFIYS